MVRRRAERSEEGVEAGGGGGNGGRRGEASRGDPPCLDHHHYTGLSSPSSMVVGRDDANTRQGHPHPPTHPPSKHCSLEGLPLSVKTVNYILCACFEVPLICEINAIGDEIYSERHFPFCS